MTTITLEEKEYQLDIEQAKKLGLLKEKDNRVKSWEEFVNKHLKSNSFYCNGGIINQATFPCNLSEQLTPHEAKALASFSRLLKLRRDWIGEWEPDWENVNTNYGVIRVNGNEPQATTTYILVRPLSFPDYEMAKEFLETFRNLIEEAKILL